MQNPKILPVSTDFDRKPARLQDFLSKKEQKFLELYAQTGISGQSYIDAGLPASTRNTACVMADRLLKKVNANMSHQQMLDYMYPKSDHFRQMVDLGTQRQDYRAAVQANVAIGKWRGYEANTGGGDTGVAIIYAGSGSTVQINQSNQALISQSSSDTSSNNQSDNIQAPARTIDVASQVKVGKPRIVRD